MAAGETTGGPAPDPHLAAVLAVGVPGAEAMPTAPLDDDAWRRLLDRVRAERVLGLLGACVDRGWPLTPEQAAEIRRIRMQRALWSFTLDRALLRVGEALDGAGISFRVLKGVALGRVAYPDVTWRDSADVDLLVAPDDLDAAAEAIRGVGALDKPVALFGPSWEARAKGIDLFLPDQRVEIDLHRRVEGSFGSQHLPASAKHPPVWFEVGDRRFAALRPEGQLVQAALHLTMINTRLSTVADILRLHRPDTTFAPAFVADLTPVTAATVLWALDVARTWCPLPPAPYEAQLAARTTRAAVARQRYVQAHPSVAPLVGALERPTLRAKAAGVRDFVRPSDAFLASKGRTPTGQLKRLAATARGLGRR